MTFSIQSLARISLAYFFCFMMGMMNLGFAEDDFHSTLMRSTFKIEGNGSMGTCFILGEPIPSRPGMASFVLFTAAHVFNEMRGEMAVIHLRKLENETYERLLMQIRIRQGDDPLWIEHPDADIAALRISLPSEADISLVTTDLFATDSLMQEFEIHPGDELMVLGFPLGAESNEAGFPILRSGRIASYPLFPTREVSTFLLDFEVFKGNSGGPVYLWSENRVYAGGTHAGVVQMLMGLVSKATVATETIQSITETITRDHTLALATIVQASYLKELLQDLPPISE